ncbi:unnamed protein product [Closterium sp. Naga37s-1]|nr:unnamed protein product [Closterium sp. Naga37s-1]
MGGPAVSEAVIVGGGLAGLALAIGLRNIGIDAQVYEARDYISGGEGTGITLYPNGLRALNRIDPGILSQLCSRGVPDPTCLFLTPFGHCLSRWDLSTNMTARYGFPMLAIGWREVQDVLFRMVPKDAIHTGHRLVAISQNEEAEGGSRGDGTVKCVFRKVSGGKECLLEVETPLLLGADGIFSETRKHLLGEGVEPRDNRRTIWRAIIDSSAASHPLLQPRQGLTILAGDRSGFIMHGHANKLYWGLMLADGADPTVSSSRSSCGEEAKEKILRALKGWDVLPRIVEATPPECIVERRILDMPSLPFWIKGRTALLGDAAHAVTPELGHGANLAFEDAAQMVECIRAHSDVRCALESFQSLRMPRLHAMAAKNDALVKALYLDTQADNVNGSSQRTRSGVAPVIRGAITTLLAAVTERRDTFDSLYAHDTVEVEDHVTHTNIVGCLDFLVLDEVGRS